MIGRLFVMLTGLFAVGSACVASPPLENLLIGNHDSRFDKLAASIMRIPTAIMTGKKTAGRWRETPMNAGGLFP